MAMLEGTTTDPTVSATALESPNIPLEESIDDSEELASVASKESTEHLSVEERLTRALNCKEAGNNALNKGDFNEAAKMYEKGLNFLEGLDHVTSGPIDVKKPLCMNFALVKLKQGSFSKCVELATKALGMETDNVKALYRRGSAYFGLGDHRRARADLRRVVSLQPNNRDARLQLEALQAAEAKAQRNEKAAYSSMFSGAGGKLYEDKEKEMEDRLVRAAEEKKMRQMAWSNEMRERKERDEEEIPFELWEKKLEEKERQSDQAAEKPKIQAPPTPSMPASISKPSTTAVTDEDMDYDDEEKKVIEETRKKGYCYFKKDPKELTEHEQRLKQDRPVQLNGHASPASTSSSATASAWNTAGTTYEERDITPAAKTLLNNILMKTRHVEADIEAQMSSVDDLRNATEKLQEAMQALESGRPDALFALESFVRPQKGEIDIVEVSRCDGEAHVAAVRGTRRYLYDFEVDLKWKASLLLADGQKAGTYEGKLCFEDISSVRADSSSAPITARVDFGGKLPKAEHTDAVNKLIEKLRSAVSAQVSTFTDDLKQELK